MSAELWPAFVASLPQAQARAAEGEAGARLLAELYGRAREAWPDVEVQPAVFGSAVARALTDEQSIDEALAQLRAEDLYLTCACAERDERAIAAFHRLYDPIIERALATGSHHGVTIDEIRQAVWVRLLVDENQRTAKIGSYAGRGKLANWVRVVTARTRADLVRQRAGRDPTTLPSDDLAPLDGAADSPELRHLEQTYREEFREAFARAVDGLEPAGRNLLRQRIVYGLQLDQIAALFEIHPATVKRRLARTRQWLASETQRHLLERLRVGQTQLDSILRLIESRMDVSVRRLLQSDG